MINRGINLFSDLKSVKCMIDMWQKFATLYLVVQKRGQKETIYYYLPFEFENLTTAVAYSPNRLKYLDVYYGSIDCGVSNSGMNKLCRFLPEKKEILLVFSNGLVPSWQRLY